MRVLLALDIGCSRLEAEILQCYCVLVFSTGELLPLAQDVNGPHDRDQRECIDIWRVFTITWLLFTPCCILAPLIQHPQTRASVSTDSDIGRLPFCLHHKMVARLAALHLTAGLTVAVAACVRQHAIM